MHEHFQGKIGATVAQSTPWWKPQTRPPEDAPNVVLIVFDDTGFSHFGCFGSDIETPNIDRLAAGGLRFTNFHTTALCSPTRACLLSGRNHHSVGMRFLSNVDTGFSNCRGVISPRATIIPELLRDVGYSTFALGKWHLANMEDCGPAGPMSQWPLGRGFDRYYGFLGGATDQFSPELTIDNHPVDPPSDPEYHLSAAMIDQAIGMISSQRATSKRPFFSYIAFGATHSPHQAPRAYLDHYRGRYDQGWDIIRQKWFERQLELGVIPSDTELSPLNPGTRAWVDLSADQQRLYARMQEVFAGFLTHTDEQIGRLISFLEQTGELDNTLFMVLSDNGASQEGGHEGVINELAFFNRIRQRSADMLPHLDEIGGPNLYNNYPKGWAQVGNCPLRFYKQNTYEGGIRDPMVVHWPARIQGAGGIRTQYHHAIDVLPTILECTGTDLPETRNGESQMPIEGVSMAYSFDDAHASSQRSTQYYEMLGHRAIYHDGWKAVTMHKPGTPFEDDVWELYHVDEDFAEIHNVADEFPEQLARMKERWWAEAGRYNVLPLDDRSTELFAMRRPDSEFNRDEFTFRPGIAHIDRFALPDVRNRSWQMSASITWQPGQGGVLVAYGARTGGHSFYIQDNRLVFAYSYLGNVTEIVSSDVIGAAGELTVKARFEKLQEHQGRISLFVNDQAVGDAELETLPWRSTLYGMDIGRDVGSTVSASYQAPNPFTGILHFITYRLKNDRDDLQKAAAIEAENAVVDQ